MTSTQARTYSMQRLIKLTISALPLVIIGGLIYSAVFIKPRLSGKRVEPPVMTRGDFMYGIAAPTPGVLLGVGSNGKAWRSEDSGSSWTLQRTPTHSNLQDIAIWDKDRAVAVGNQGIVIVTSNGGKSWNEIVVPHSSIANKLMRVRAFEKGVAWAVGEAGACLYTKDFGAHWTRMMAEEDAAWNDVSFADQHGWMVGEFGRIGTSIDGGAHWSVAPSPVKSSLVGVAFKDEMSGVAVGLEGVVLVTHDGGRNWILVPKLTSEHLFDVNWDGLNWVAVGDKGVMVMADKTAATWRVVRPQVMDRAWHTKIISDDGHYIMTGATIGIVKKDALNMAGGEKS